MISAVADAFPSNPQRAHEQMYERALYEALHIGVWGTDYQLFPFTLLMDIQYNTFYTISDDSGVSTLSHLTLEISWT